MFHHHRIRLKINPPSISDVTIARVDTAMPQTRRPLAYISARSVFLLSDNLYSK